LIIKWEFSELILKKLEIIANIPAICTFSHKIISFDINQESGALVIST